MKKLIIPFLSIVFIFIITLVLISVSMKKPPEAVPEYSSEEAALIRLVESIPTVKRVILSSDPWGYSLSIEFKTQILGKIAPKPWGASFGTFKELTDWVQDRFWYMHQVR